MSQASQFDDSRDLTEKCCRRYVVEGRVQGVWFRDSTKKMARKYNLCGWVRNLSDGNVEILACGEIKNLDEFEKWVWVGPDAATVTHVEIITTAFEEFDKFSVESTAKREEY